MLLCFLKVPAKKMKLRQYEDLLSSDYESFKSFRNATIEKWNDKTRLATGHLKSKSFRLNTSWQTKADLSNERN